MKTFKYGNEEEKILTSNDLPLQEALDRLKNETIAILGYGVQGPAWALNLRDRGLKVIIGQREGSASWERAIEEGWEPGITLFDLNTASKKATIVCFLLSDAGQVDTWPKIKETLGAGKMLCFAHGFGITFSDQTGILPPEDIDVALIAPKGSGRSVRTLFLDNKGINASFAILQDFTGHAKQKTQALGIAIGSGYLFETTFEKEVHSDLVGERGVLMGALAAMIEAQYEILRERGHSPSEAYNETVEELTESLIPLISEQGMDWMFKNTSTTAQRGALDWKGKFKTAISPVFKELYDSVSSGREARNVLDANRKINYRKELEKELNKIAKQELWMVGTFLRDLRPKK